MFKKFLLATAVLGIAVLGSAAAYAGPIVVSNASFETLPVGGLNNAGCGTGCAYSTGLAIPGWATTGAQTGQFQPGSSGAYFNSIPDGITVGYTNGGTISQILAATAVAGSLYQLQVDLGFRKDFTDPGTISLQIGALSALATGTASQLSGDWATYTAFLTTTFAEAGAPITINLSSNGIQGDFDNVRLSSTSATAVPEPVTLSIFGAGLAGAAAIRRRRKASKA